MVEASFFREPERARRLMPFGALGVSLWEGVRGVPGVEGCLLMEVGPSETEASLLIDPETDDVRLSAPIRESTSATLPVSRAAFEAALLLEMKGMMLSSGRCLVPSSGKSLGEVTREGAGETWGLPGVSRM